MVCAVCGREFEPRATNQRCCPPTDAERDHARSIGARQARSRCAKAYSNARQRGTLDALHARGTRPAQPFDCAQCGRPCVPGSNVASHATRFCGAGCKSTWHAAHDPTGRESARRDALIISRVTRDATPTDLADYRRAMLHDPCAYCDARSEARDHIIPKSDGGPDGWDNRTGACHRCNNTKQSSPLLVFLAWRQARDAFEPWRQVVAAIHARTPLGGGPESSRDEDRRGLASRGRASSERSGVAA
jgi:5-methylcytosine-specific restriction endonuclease McrA